MAASAWPRDARGCGLVDPDLEVLPLVHGFQAAGNVGNRFESGHHRIQVDIQRPGQGRGGQGM